MLSVLLFLGLFFATLILHAAGVYKQFVVVSLISAVVCFYLELQQVSAIIVGTLIGTFVMSMFLGASGDTPEPHSRVDLE